jgi:hypothetical protein
MNQYSKHFTIKSNLQQFVLEDMEIIDLEKKLNLSPWSRDYVKIGDDLYAYYVGTNKIDHIEVSYDQFENLKYLSTRSYDEYKAETYSKKYN